MLILRYHTDGAGLNVLDLAFWECAPPRQARSWIILPTGRTEWVSTCRAYTCRATLTALQGLDWHGPSAVNAWQSVAALAAILDGSPLWRAWAYPADTRVVLLGHSNGGQGTWHVAGRFPDKVLAGKHLIFYAYHALASLFAIAVPVAAYSKSQSYVPLLQSRRVSSVACG